LAAKGRLEEARATLAELQRLAAAVPADAMAGQNTVKDVFGLRWPSCKPGLRPRRIVTDEAISKLAASDGGRRQTRIRRTKELVLSSSAFARETAPSVGQASEAESVYREDLAQNPANGWALYGLSAALEAQGKRTEAAQVTRQFQAACGTPMSRWPRRRFSPRRVMTSHRYPQINR